MYFLIKSADIIDSKSVCSLGGWGGGRRLVTAPQYRNRSGQHVFLYLMLLLPRVPPVLQQPVGGVLHHLLVEVTLQDLLELSDYLVQSSPGEQVRIVRPSEL